MHVCSSDTARVPSACRPIGLRRRRAARRQRNDRFRSTRCVAIQGRTTGRRGRASALADAAAGLLASIRPGRAGGHRQRAAQRPPGRRPRAGRESSGTCSVATQAISLDSPGSSSRMKRRSWTTNSAEAGRRFSMRWQRRLRANCQPTGRVAAPSGHRVILCAAYPGMCSITPGKSRIAQVNHDPDN